MTAKGRRGHREKSSQFALGFGTNPQKAGCAFEGPRLLSCCAVLTSRGEWSGRAGAHASTFDHLNTQVSGSLAACAVRWAPRRRPRCVANWVLEQALRRLARRQLLKSCDRISARQRQQQHSSTCNCPSLADRRETRGRQDHNLPGRSRAPSLNDRDARPPSAAIVPLCGPLRVIGITQHACHTAPGVSIVV